MGVAALRRCLDPVPRPPRRLRRGRSSADATPTRPSPTPASARWPSSAVSLAIWAGVRLAGRAARVELPGVGPHGPVHALHAGRGAAAHPRRAGVDGPPPPRQAAALPHRAVPGPSRSWRPCCSTSSSSAPTCRSWSTRCGPTRSGSFGLDMTWLLSGLHPVDADLQLDPRDQRPLVPGEDGVPVPRRRHAADGAGRVPHLRRPPALRHLRAGAPGRRASAPSTTSSWPAPS